MERNNIIAAVSQAAEELIAAAKPEQGDLLIVGDTLYKATAAIASGETIAAGTNVAATTVAEQLLLLANI